MAGSLSHIINTNGRFIMDYIDNLGDAYEALEECFILIHELSNGDTQIIGKACRKHNFSDPWEDRFKDDHKEPMQLN